MHDIHEMLGARVSKDLSSSARVDRRSGGQAASAGDQAQPPAAHTRRERRWRYTTAIQATLALNGIRIQSLEPEVP